MLGLDRLEAKRRGSRIVACPCSEFWSLSSSELSIVYSEFEVSRKASTWLEGTGSDLSRARVDTMELEVARSSVIGNRMHVLVLSKIRL